MPLLKKVNVDDGGPQPYLFFAEKALKFNFSVNFHNCSQQSCEKTHKQCLFFLSIHSESEFQTCININLKVLGK